MNIHKLCIYAGPLSFVCFTIAMAGTGFTLPLSSTLSAAEVVAYYQEHLFGIRVAALLLLFCGTFMVAFAIAIARQMQQIEGGVTPWILMQVAGGILGNLPFILTAIIWTTAALRLERPPEITQSINDLSWFTLELPGPSATLQFLAIAAAVFGDKSANPSLPRWVGYVNILATLAFLPGAAGGVLGGLKVMDWNGAVSYWLPGIASASWVWLMFAALLRADRITTKNALETV
jgi:hypothetical protein